MRTTRGGKKQNREKVKCNDYNIFIGVSQQTNREKIKKPIKQHIAREFILYHTKETGIWTWKMVYAIAQG